MTLFAVACAGMFPILHMGRPWVGAYWLMPYPNTMGLWPNFRSPLIWDVFAVSTYATVSALFWFVGLIPDLATLRDRAQHPVVRTIYGMLALGWRGSARHWANYETAYLILAGLSTPLVVSVHTVVSFDFAVGVVPGWHATIFPPYFVAGAIYAGFAMVLTLAIPLRKAYGLEDFITMKHIENMAKVMLATGLVVAYGYLMEAFMAWYSGNTYERFMMWNRMTGPYAWSYWALILCNVVVINTLWVKRLRTSVPYLFVVSLVVSVGMWLERFVIIVTSLHRDFLPSSWGNYRGTPFDWSMFIGTIGLFLTLFFLFIRFLPAISIFEMRTLVPGAAPQGGGGMSRPALYGLLAEFHTPAEIVKAAAAVHAAGYRKVDAYTPYPMEEVLDALHLHQTHVPKLVLAGGLFGMAAGWGLQYWSSVIEYPMNIGGRPFFAWPAFVDPDLRDDRALRRPGRRLRDAGAQRLPPALPPGLQRAELRDREPRPLLPLHRVGRPEVRRREDARVPEGPRGGGGVGGAAMSLVTPRSTVRPARRGDLRDSESPLEGPREGPRERTETSSAAAPSSSCSPRRCRLPAGHARPAEVPAAARAARSSPTSARRGPSSRARSPAGRCARTRSSTRARSGTSFVTEIPVKVTAELLARGQTQFQVFCSPCHGRTGRGDGMIVQRGFKKPSSYHVDRLRQMPIGYFYDVMTNGFGAMSDYSAQVPPPDRWAIAAYVRALQLSQYAPAADVPADKHGELDASLAAARRRSTTDEPALERRPALRGGAPAAPFSNGWRGPASPWAGSSCSPSPPASPWTAGSSSARTSSASSSGSASAWAALGLAMLNHLTGGPVGPRAAPLPRGGGPHPAGDGAPLRPGRPRRLLALHLGAARGRGRATSCCRRRRPT